MVIQWKRWRATEIHLDQLLSRWRLLETCQQIFPCGHMDEDAHEDAHAHAHVHACNLLMNSSCNYVIYP
jgi:hypothetical protein